MGSHPAGPCWGHDKSCLSPVLFKYAYTSAQRPTSTATSSTRKTIGDEDCYLGSGSTGAQILWKEDGKDTIVWAVVRLGTSSLTLFEIQEAWSLDPVLDITDAPANWAHTTGKRVRYHRDTSTWSTNDGDKTEYLWHSAGYLPGQDPDTGNWTANDELTLGVFYPRFSVGDWVCVCPRSRIGAFGRSSNPTRM